MGFGSECSCLGGVRWVGNYFLWEWNGFGINGGISEDGLNFSKNSWVYIVSWVL